MRTDRRAFVAAGVAAAMGERSGRAAAPSRRGDVDGLPVLDFGRSFVSGTASFNRVRFWVESRTMLLDGARRHEFLQCGACKSENTFAARDLFHADNYDFLPILGDDEHWLIFRRRNRIAGDYRTVRKEVWGPAERKLRYAAGVEVLSSFERIRDATAAGRPLVSRTEIADAATGLRAIIEAPVKTINIEPARKLYQIDTGPVALPDLSRRYQPSVDCLRLAFVAFNAPGFADFVVEQPTPVVEDGRERCRVYHYSSPVTLTARNSLLAVTA